MAAAALDPELFLPEPDPRDVKYTIVSVDDHVVEPPHVFERYLPKNLRERGPQMIETPEGRLVTIDLDEVLSGPFHWELGAALLRCLWGTTSRRLDTLPLDALLSSPRLLAAEAAYLDAAPASRDQKAEKAEQEAREAVAQECHKQFEAEWTAAVRSAGADCRSAPDGAGKAAGRRRPISRWARSSGANQSDGIRRPFSFAHSMAMS